ncbi:ABC transporter substrate-binding protein [Sulfurimonas sp. C5]|uniref:ABC transporter substrate-binding protein n=1 Tax=Sulfurimonas sp. C5 TaxID=3036947 RepID=UPI0024539B8E|nr:ABC transporter substrate-binding protein [Sulfurimonas sp. C5]MDH4944585.1 diguanylate cyclase [Sulfurimonas sp. C5]
MKLLQLFLFLLLLTFTLSAQELKKVSLQLQWKYQFQFAGYIMAKEKGFYKEAGLDVTLKEWQPGIRMENDVIQGKSEYATCRASSLIDISNGKKIVYLASIFQSSPLVVLADKSSHIKNIQDFKHKRIMATRDIDVSLFSMMYSQGIMSQDIQVIQPSFNPADLLNGKTDLIAAYVSNEVYVLKSLGGKPVIFNPKDYGFDFYSDLLITSQEYLKDNPQEVKRFRNASLEGWKYAFEHIDETVDIIYNKYNSLHKTKEALRYEAEELKKLAYYGTDTLGSINKQKLQRIYDVYKLLGLVQKEIDLRGTLFSDYALDTELTTKEKEYLAKRQEITMCIDPNWMPFEHFSEDGKYEGMTADYFQAFEKTLATNFRVIPTKTWTQSIEFAKERKCDIFSLAMETPKRKEYMNFTSPYLVIPLVVATKLEVPFVSDIKDLEKKKIGICKGYAFAELLKMKYPFLNIVEVEDIDDGLRRVSDGELFGYIGTLASIGYKLQNNYIGKLKITGKIEESWTLGIGVRNDEPLLLSILQKAVNSLSQEENRKIFNKWISIKYDKEVDYMILWKVIAFFIFIFAVGYLLYRKQQRLKESLQEANDKLEVAYEALQEIAITDKLTQLYNRHKLDEVLQAEKNRVDRYGGSFGIIILDIDYFKIINDTYGHHVGDIVLQELSTLLRENSRASDTIGRWGGEEFLIIAPNLSEDDIENFAQNIKDKISKYLFNNTHKITVSMGLSVYHIEEDVEKSLVRADNALYISKNSGRDKITLK